MRLIDADKLEQVAAQYQIRHTYDLPLSRTDFKTIDRFVSEWPTADGWISVKDRLPEDERSVLAVCQLKDGSRKMTLAYCNLDYRYHDMETGEERMIPYWVCGGNNNVIWWQPLPEMPKE